MIACWGGLEHVTAWTCKQWDVNRLCQKIYPISGRGCSLGHVAQLRDESVASFSL